MKEFLLISMLALAMGCGSLRNGKTVEASAATTERVVVTAVLQDEERVLARPQIMLDNGKEGELQISTQMPVPGREDAIATGLHLAILPRVNGGRIVFQGHWVFKEPAGKEERTDLQFAAFHSTEAFFAGLARSGETKVVKVQPPNGRPMDLQLKFVIMVNTAVRK